MVFIPATCLDHAVSTGAWESQMQPPCGCHTLQNTKFFWLSLWTTLDGEQLHIRRVRQIRIFLADLYPLYLILLSFSFSILMVPLPCTAFHFIMYPWHCLKFKGSRQETYRGICRQGNRKSASVEFAKPTASLCLPTKLETDEVHWNILVFPFCAVNTLAVTNDL